MLNQKVTDKMARDFRFVMHEATDDYMQHLEDQFKDYQDEIMHKDELFYAIKAELDERSEAKEARA